MFIYVIAQAGLDSPCKVGKSWDPYQRAVQLGNGSQYDFKVMHAEKCEWVNELLDWKSSRPYFYADRELLRIEKTAHQVLQQFWLKGEWFNVRSSSAMAIVKICVEQARPKTKGIIYLTPIAESAGYE